MTLSCSVSIILLRDSIMFAKHLFVGSCSNDHIIRNLVYPGLVPYEVEEFPYRGALFCDGLRN